VPPEDLVAGAVEDRDLLLTGKATAVDSPTKDLAKMRLRVHKVWSGPKVERQVSVQISGLRHAGMEPATVGTWYHVLIEEDGSAGPCTVWRVDDFPTNLMGGLTPQQTYPVKYRPVIFDEPVDNSAEKAEWWRTTAVAAVSLAALTFVSVLKARRRPTGKRHPGLGALVGLDVGAAVGGGLVILPLLRQGNFYEAGTPLLFGFLPILVVATALGTVVGTFIRGSTARVVLATVSACLVLGPPIVWCWWLLMP
jgi:hypothetical protein